jgi:hypothetical protein
MKDKYSDQHYKIAKDEFDGNYRLRDKFEAEMEEYMEKDWVPAPYVIPKEKLISQLISNIASVRRFMYLGHFFYKTKKDKQQGRDKVRAWIKEIRRLTK